MEYLVGLDEKMAHKVSVEFIKQLKNDTADGGVMEACDIILTYLNPRKVIDFGVSME